jgi:hypothetical protein
MTSIYYMNRLLYIYLLLRKNIQDSTHHTELSSVMLTRCHSVPILEKSECAAESFWEGEYFI